jgi:hypothetical protein
MPLPVLAGIPLLVTFLGGLVASAFSYITLFISKKFILVSAAILVIVGITTAFFSALNALTSSISFAAPPWYNLAVQLVVPENATFCVSAMLSAHLLRFAYDWNVKLIRMKIN